MSLSIVLIIYNMPFILARNNTAKPSARFRILANASSPYHGCCPFNLVHMFRLNIAPVKNVATAIPIRNGPNDPLRKRKISNVFCPKTLSGFDLYSYATA